MATRGQGKMANLINYRLRVTLLDGREMVGQMMAYDRHMNLVLSDVEEFRKIKKRSTKQGSSTEKAAAPMVETEERRSLGLVILRGAHIISSTVESPPPSDPATRLGTNAPSSTAATMAAGPGVARGAGRGTVSLQGPAAGGPSFGGFGGAAPGFGAGRGFPPGPPPPGFAPPPGFVPGGGPPGFGRGGR